MLQNASDLWDDLGPVGLAMARWHLAILLMWNVQAPFLLGLSRHVLGFSWKSRENHQTKWMVKLDLKLNKIMKYIIISEI